jgi:hypothetical protein
MAIAEGRSSLVIDDLFFIELEAVCINSYFPSGSPLWNRYPLGKENMALDLEVLRGDLLA